MVPVTLYRWTAPFRVSRCRFYPSCSTYAVEALGEHGALKGLWLAVRRVLRCHPWNVGGIDPVPPRKGTRTGLAHDHAQQPHLADPPASAGRHPTRK
ncbi:MAG: membrane protein insertion efficiency factor YidD [Nitriliruptoraceae bacterium]